MDPNKPTIHQLREQLQQLEAFLASPAHKEFQAIHQAEYDAIQENIFDHIPMDKSEILTREQAIGRGGLLKNLPSWFEDWGTVLRQSIAELETTNQ